MNPADAEQALKTFHSAIRKCEKAQMKLKEESPQRKWVRRQLEAYYIAVSCIEEVFKDNASAARYTESERVNAAATLCLLTEICGKLPEKFKDNHPQQTLAIRRLSAFRLALPLINSDSARQ
jgi:hypothetical protein